MGGGGFTMEPGNPALDRYILDLAAVPSPRICFLPTASGDADRQLARFHERFSTWPCEPSTLSLFRLGSSPLDVRTHLLSQDVIYVGGGSMRNMLAIWREHGLDSIMRDAWQRGIVLAGLSAGAMCWFEGGITKSMGEPAPTAGLGFLPGSLTVHLNGEPDRRPVYLDAVRSGALAPGWALDDGAALLFCGDTLVEAVASRPGARAFRVDREGGRSLEVRDLSDCPARPNLPEDIAEMRLLRHLSRMRYS
jgi:peptidase E